MNRYHEFNQKGVCKCGAQARSVGRDELCPKPIYQQEVAERAAHVLRCVAEGKSFSTAYFWNVTMAMEAFRDGNPRDVEIHIKEARRICPNIETYEFTRADIAAQKAVSNG